MPKFIVHVLFIAICTFGALEAMAQESNSVPGKPVAALDVLVEEVLRNNPELKFYEAEIEAAKGSRYTAGLWANPEISGSAGQKKVWNEDRELTGKGSTGELAITQTFEWPGRMGLKRAIADRDIELSNLGLERFRSILKSRAKIAFYKLFAARAGEAAALEVAGHFSSLREVLNQRTPAGLTPLLESRIIEAMDFSTQRKASEASLSAKSALLELNQLRGAPIGADLSLGNVELEFRPLSKSAEEIASLAKTGDYSVQEKKIELERQSLRVGLEENKRFPDVTVGPSISQEKAGDRERVMAVAASIPLPLWNQNQGNIGEARARRAQAETAHFVAERAAERHALEEILAYETKVKEMSKRPADSIQHFREAAELADRHYRLGAVPVSTYIELQTQYLEAIGGLHGTKIEALEAATQLEVLTGEELCVIKVVGEPK